MFMLTWGLGGQLLTLNDNFSSSRAQLDSTVGAIDIFDILFVFLHRVSFCNLNDFAVIN